MYDDEMIPDGGGAAVERSVELAASAQTIWDHVTRGELLGAWMDGDVVIDARRGGAIRMTRPGAPDVWGVVEDITPGHRLQWCWRTDDGLPTMVEIELCPAPGTTTLTVRETLLPWRSIELPPQWTDGGAPSAMLGVARAA
jgi:uncharacterized protein YndB with AHSA1/START domain